LTETEGNSEKKTKLKMWHVHQGIQKYYCSLFNMANNSICLLTGMSTYYSLALTGVKELYRYHIITMHTGLSLFIILNQRFLTGYKEIRVLSTLCQDTWNEQKKAWWRRCQTV